MCGIAGIISRHSGFVNQDQLKAMSDAMVHRGPDGEGHYINEIQNIGFAHRRLSIIDLDSRSAQPMITEGGNLVITFNGEIYNYLELKAELKSSYEFKTQSDTEVILAAYQQWGPSCLTKFDGMFAFAIYDKSKNHVVLARDRFGEKPLFYTFHNSGLYFASDLNALWKAGISKNIPRKIQSQFLVSSKVDNQDTSSTYFEDIHSLPGSHYTVIDANEPSVQISRYWQLKESTFGTFQGNEKEAAAKVDKLFRESVERRLRSDVKVGSSLSGGLDSSYTVGVINSLNSSSKGQETFSARFKNFSKDEGHFIDLVKSQYPDIKNHSTWPSEESLEADLQRLVDAHSQPSQGSSIYAQFKVFELAKQMGVTVNLDGQGADEIFGGYTPFYKQYLYKVFLTDTKKYKKELAAYSEKYQNTYPFTDLYQDETIRMKLGRIKSKLPGQKSAIDSNYYQKHLKKSLMQSSLPTLLRYADVNSMAHSLEVRLPYLFHELVEFALTLPDHFLAKNGWTKHILRLSSADVVPDEIRWRVDKIGFEAPEEKIISTPVFQKKINEVLSDFSQELDQTNVVNKRLKWRALMLSYH